MSIAGRYHCNSCPFGLANRHAAGKAYATSPMRFYAQRTTTGVASICFHRYGVTTGLAGAYSRVRRRDNNTYLTPSNLLKQRPLCFHAAIPDSLPFELWQYAYARWPFAPIVSLSPRPSSRPQTFRTRLPGIASYPAATLARRPARRMPAHSWWMSRRSRPYQRVETATMTGC